MDKKQKTKRYFSLFLALIMLIGMMPMNIFAEVEKADWNIETVSETSAQKELWSLSKNNKLVRVSEFETKRTPAINYVGTYTNSDGREVIRLSYNLKQTAVSAVWKNLVLKFPKEFIDAVDWKYSKTTEGKTLKTGMYKGLYNDTKHDYYRSDREIQPFSVLANTESVVGGYGIYYQNLNNAGNNAMAYRTEIPMDFVLNEGKSIKDFQTQILIQARLMDEKFERVYVRTSDQNPIASYNAYTFTTVIPAAGTDYKKDLNTFFVSNASPFDAVTSYVTYDLDAGIIDVVYKQSKGTTGSTYGGLRKQENPLGFRQAVEASFLDILDDERTSGAVAEVTILDNSDKPYGNNNGTDPRYNIFLSKDDFTVKDDLAFIQIGAKEWKSDWDYQSGINTKIISQEFSDAVLNGASSPNSGLSTRVRYYVKKDVLNALIKENGLKSYAFYSAIVNQDAYGTTCWTLQADEDIILKAGDQVNLKFNDNQGYKEALTYYDPYKEITIGKDQYSIKFTENITRRFAATGPNAYKEFTWTVPVDIKIPKGETISVRGGYNGEVNGKPLASQTLTMVINNRNLEFTNPELEHKPRILNWSSTLTGGALDQTILRPRVDEVFTDSNKISGYSYYDRAEIGFRIPNVLDDEHHVLKQTISASNVGEEVKFVENDIIVPYTGYKFSTSEPNIAGNEQLKQYEPFRLPAKLEKDMPIFINNRNSLSGSIEGEDVIEQVQAKVKFIPGGPLGDVNYDKVAPLNKKYLYNYELTSDTLTFTKNDAYTANGFGELDENGDIVAGTVDNIKVDGNAQVIDVDGEKMINYINHDEQTYDINASDTVYAEEQKQALAKRQWPVVKGDDGSKFINGKTLIGWTTVKLEDDAEGTAAQKYNKLVEYKKIVDEVADWPTAKNTAYVFNAKSPITEAVTVYGVWGEPAIRLHSNFGTQDYVETQTLEKAVLDKLAINTDPSTIDATLKEVYNKAEFKREGYSLVGFSRDPDANEPDINVTVDGFTKDLYLRDGDTFKLASKGTETTSTGDVLYDYTFDAAKGIDLYAVWKPDFTIKATKEWINKEGGNFTPDLNKTSTLKFAIIGRPAVGTFGNEVVLDAATYHPIEGTIKAYTGGDITWGEGNEAKLKGYDSKGRRMSYLLVELTDDKQVEAFNNGSSNWSDYKIKITEPDEAAHVYGHKDQVVELGTGADIDSFTSATTRLHKTAQDPDGINPHGGALTHQVGYFDTTGYIIQAKNTQLDVPKPTIEKAYTGDATIKVDPPKTMVDKITVTLPDGRTAIFNKNETSDGYVPTKTGTANDAVLKFEGGKLLITPSVPLNKGDRVTAISEKTVADVAKQSEEDVMIVEDRKASNKPTDLEQGKYNDDGDVPISFKVPDNIVDKPTAGTVYTVVLVDKDGSETPTTHTYTIPADGAETIPGTTQEIVVPKSELEGKKVIIRAEEPNKAPTDSDELKLDFTAPAITTDARDERWRRWANIDVTLDEAPAGPITLTYKEDGTEKTETYDTKEELKYVIEKLKLKDNITDMKIKAADKFGNEEAYDVSYTPIGQTQIVVSPIRVGKNFVTVKAKEANTKVVVNVYEKGTLLDNYTRDKYFAFAGPDTPTPKATAELTLTEVNKAYRLRLQTPDGTTYVLQAGDVVDIVGSIGEPGPDYKITNPFTEILR
ncbi:MAG: hypothetical protein MSH08_00585 [Ezakiella sp.]|nr:hypothetical protein [Ezakiella sp.]